MAQHDYFLSNQTAASYRAEHNECLQAIVTNNSGDTEPTTKFAFQIWVDTSGSDAVVKQRNEANDAWVEIYRLSGSNQSVGDLTVNGNISVTGTVDGRDVAADGTKLDGVEAGATADQTAAEIRTLVESASDSNVFTDADHTKLDGIETGATADQTASEILTAIKTVDGGSSGLDADLLDGQHGSYYQNASNLNAGTISDARIPDTISPATRVDTKEVRTSNGTELVLNAGESSGKIAGQTAEIVYINAESGLRVCTPSVDNWGTGYVERRTNITGDGIYFHRDTTAMGEITTSDTSFLRINQNTDKPIYTPRYMRADGGFFVDGTSKGINGSGNFIGGTISGASDYGSLLRSNASDQYDGQTSGRVMRFRCVDGRNAGSSDGSLFPLEVFQNSNTTNSDAALSFHIANRYAAYFGLNRETNDLFFGGWSVGAVKHKVWHQGNDGSGSGLDADKVDGIQASSFLRSDANDTASGDITFSNNINCQNRIYVGSSDNGQAIEVDRSSSYNTHLYIGGWSSSNSNDIARIRCSDNLHLDSPANGDLYLNWYSQRNINWKGTIQVGGNEDGKIVNGRGALAPSYTFNGDTDTGFNRPTSNAVGFVTGNTERGRIAGDNVKFYGVYNTTTSGGTNVRVDSLGRLRRHSSSRQTKTNIEPMAVEFANKILDQVQPIWYRPRVPDPNYPQAYLDSLGTDEQPTVEGCESYCQDNEIEWEVGDSWMNEGCNPNWSYWGFVAEDLAEVDPRLCSRNPETGVYDSVQYEEFAPLLLKIAQEQKKQITNLEVSVAALEARLAALESPAA